MAIYLTGDTHGILDIEKVFQYDFPDDLTKEDYLIILGDFGFIWDTEPSEEERCCLSALDRFPFTTLFLDGNHENHARLNSFPTEEWKGGTIHRITDSIFHLMRGSVFTLQGQTFFVFGGASSIDKAIRKEGLSWWREEVPSFQEQETGFQNIEKHHFSVDYVLTHTCPNSTVDKLVYANMIRDVIPDPTGKILEAFYETLTFKHWYFGHFHADKKLTNRFTCLYKKIIKLGDSTWF